MNHWRDNVAVTWEPGDPADFHGDAPSGAALRDRAAALAQELGVAAVAPVAAGRPPSTTPRLALVVTPRRLELRVLGGDDELTRGRGVAAELDEIDVTSGPGRSLRTPLLRAVGIRKGEAYRPRVLDATAGLGEDAWLLAAAGCEVVAVERQPVIAALLRDALARVADRAAAGRITVVTAEAREAVARAADEAPDVVYLDPMFPGSAKRKTAERKPMRVLRLLVGEDADADELLEPALRTARRRVVVKRPTRAAPLAGRKPTVTHEGRGFRFDVYVPTAR